MRLLSSFVALVSLAACSTPPTGVAADVMGTSWTVERIITPDGVLRQEAQISFGDEGSVAMSSCNQCSGRYRMRDDVFTSDGGLACTKRACTSGQLELERYFTGPVSLRQEGTYLVAEPQDLPDVAIYLARSNVP